MAPVTISLEVNGERFTPDVHIYFNQTEFPTTFINAQKLVTDIPANLISAEGSRQIIVQSPDGKAYSTQVMLVVQAPPRPGFKYVGMIGRKRYNNDTAYFLEASKPVPFGARLNDVVGGRFRLINITPQAVTFEDTTLGFKHQIPIEKSTSGGSGSSPGAAPGSRGNNGFPGADPGFQPYNPNAIPQDIPGIPNNIPRYVPPNPTDPKQPTNKKDVDDDGGDRGGHIGCAQRAVTAVKGFVIIFVNVFVYCCRSSAVAAAATLQQRRRR